MEDWIIYQWGEVCEMRLNRINSKEKGEEGIREFESGVNKREDSPGERERCLFPPSITDKLNRVHTF